MGLSAGMLVDGRYLLQAQIGRGGMARVFRALNQKNGELVALKEISLPEDEEDRVTMRGWFRREIKALMAIQHPCVVKLIDHGEHNDQPWVVTELLHGTDLQAVLETRGPLDEGSVYSVAMQGLDALALAHKLGIVHRDLKPGNLFLCDDGRVVMLDFGLARGIDPNVSLSLQKGFNTKILGTPQYWSPEQIQGVTLSVRSDLFSFGATLFALLVGKPPHAGETPFEVAAKIMTRQRAKLMDVRPETKPSLAAAIEQLIEYEPEKRPADGGEAVQLFKALQDEFGGKTEVRLRPLRKSGPLPLQHDTVTGPHVGAVQDDTRVGSAKNVSINNAALSGVTVTPTRIDSRVAEGTRVMKIAPPPAPRSRTPLLVALALGGLAVAGAVLAIGFSQPPQEVQVTPSAVVPPVPSAPPVVAAPASLPSPTEVPTIAEVKEPTLLPEETPQQKPEKPVERPIEKKEPAGDGVFKLTLKQWAEVEIDGKSQGRQQIAAQFKLPSGKHEVILRNKKFGERKLLIVVKANQETVIRNDFEKN